MKKVLSKHQDSENSTMLPEYNFQGGVRGKHYKAYRKGHTVKIHKSDGTTVVQYFKLEEGAVLLEPDIREYKGNELVGITVLEASKRRNKVEINNWMYRNESHVRVW